VNPFKGNTRFKMDEIGQVDQNIAFAIDKLKVGEFTNPMPFTTRDGKQAYRIIYLKLRTKPHKANLKDDYQEIQTVALANEKQAIITQWVKKKSSENYIRISSDYKNCEFTYNWTQNNVK
jgi:peptidyl-prolyl cis-trans isomerase SurA